LAPLTDATASGSWPTPTQQDAENTAGPSQFRRNSLPLNTAVMQWPTPSANQQSGGVTGLNGGSGARAKLRALVGREESLLMAGGSLNPTWVEWLMGYPLGWTAFKASATPSSRRSRNGSPVESSTLKG